MRKTSYMKAVLTAGLFFSFTLSTSPALAEDNANEACIGYRYQINEVIREARQGLPPQQQEEIEETADFAFEEVKALGCDQEAEAFLKEILSAI